MDRLLVKQPIKSRPKPPGNPTIVTPRRVRGVAAVEAAVALGVLMLLIVGGLEIALAVIRSNTLSACARELARTASLHGSNQAPLEQWGPTTVNTTAAGSHAAATHLAPRLTTMIAANVQVEMTWPDGDNRPGSHVRVTLHCTHSPLVSLAAWCVPRELTASSQMQIGY